MPGDPKQCREHAAACRRLAQRATGETACQTFLTLADIWDRLATELDSAARFLEAMEAIEPPNTVSKAQKLSL